MTPPPIDPRLQQLSGGASMLDDNYVPSPIAAPAYPPGFTFQDLQEKTKNLKKQWLGKIERCKKNRLLRNMEVDNEEMRQRGKFKPDEIYIPFHVINDNISKESASYIKFITASPNAGIFKIKNDGNIYNFQPLERVFTSAVRYEGNEQEIFPLIDGFQLHGIDYLETKYEPSRPGYFEHEHIGYENLWYSTKVQRGKFQAAPILVKNCEVTKDELLGVTDINKEQVELLFKDKDKNDPEKDFICIQKLYYRVEGTVNVCWMNVDLSTDFLRIPKPLHLGRIKIVKDEFTGIEISRQPIFENFYPIVAYPYTISENKQIAETRGRACLDENTQEAVSSMVSNIVNGYHQACQTFWSPKNQTSSVEIEQLDLVIEKGRGFNQPVEFDHPPYPDVSGMQIVNTLLTQNKGETSQINFAVGNREDYASRKTAKEVDVADKKEAELTTTQVILLSCSWTETLTIDFLIFKSQVEIGTIQVEGFDLSLMEKDLQVMSAGITEVMQRQETLQNLQNLWPVVQTTPAAMTVLQEIIRLMVPTLADKIISSLGIMDDKQLIASLVAIITAIAKEHPEVIPPESYEQLGALLQQAQGSLEQVTGAPGEAMGGEMGGNPQQQQQPKQIANGQPNKQPATAGPVK